MMTTIERNERILQSPHCQNCSSFRGLVEGHHVTICGSTIVRARGLETVDALNASTDAEFRIDPV
jgi:hypothetical protein